MEMSAVLTMGDIACLTFVAIFILASVIVYFSSFAQVLVQHVLSGTFVQALLSGIAATIATYILGRLLTDSQNLSITSLVAGLAIFFRAIVMDRLKGKKYEPLQFSTDDSANNGEFSNSTPITEHSKTIGWKFTWKFRKEFSLIPTISINESKLGILGKPKIVTSNPRINQVEVELKVDFDNVIPSSKRTISFSELTSAVQLKANANAFEGSKCQNKILKCVGVKVES